MKITLNNMGQVLDIEKSVLVANSSMDVSIQFVIEGLSTTQKRLMTIGLLSVIREDGFEIKNIVMQPSFSEDKLIFTYALQDAAQILAVPGNIQISAQIKSLKEQYDGMTGDVRSDIENYNTFSSVTVAGFVQHNIGTAREENFANTLVETKIIPVLQTFGEAMNQFVEIKEQFEDLKRGVETSYIDLYLFLNNKEGLKTAIQAAYDARPLGAERANIVFYNSSTLQEDQFLFPVATDLFISNCNYSFIDSDYYMSTNQIYLRGLKNCDFYGVKAGAVSESAVLFVEDCENLQFTNCYFGNGQAHAIEIKNSTAIYFENTEIGSDSFRNYTFVNVSNTNTAYNNITFNSCLFKQPSTLLPTAIDATETTNTKAVVLLSTCLFSDGVPVYGENIKKGVAQVVLSPTETREKYIDVSEFIIGGVSDYTRFNARLKELASQAKGGQDRAEIFFYQTNKTHDFVFDSNVAWQSNCNYHNLLASYTETSGTATGKPVVFDGIENCDFYGFNFSQYSAQACVRILASCSNLYFERCLFSGTYAYVCECYGKNLRFDGCTFAFLSNIGDSLVYIENKASDLSVCIFENCKFVMSHVTTAHHALNDYSTNAKSLTMVLHCYEDNLSEIGASKIEKGNNSTIRVSALQTI